MSKKMGLGRFEEAWLRIDQEKKALCSRSILQAQGGHMGQCAGGF